MNNCKQLQAEFQTPLHVSSDQPTLLIASDSGFLKNHCVPRTSAGKKAMTANGGITRQSDARGERRRQYWLSQEENAPSDKFLGKRSSARSMDAQLDKMNLVACENPVRRPQNEGALTEPSRADVVSSRGGEPNHGQFSQQSCSLHPPHDPASWLVAALDVLRLAGLQRSADDFCHEDYVGR